MNNAIKATNGNSHEADVRLALDSLGLKEGIDFETQLQAPEYVSRINNVDFMIYLSNGESMWIPALTDYYSGTYQRDRLEHTYQMTKHGIWDKWSVFYVLRDATLPKSKLKQPTRQQKAASQSLAFVKRKGTAGSIADLVELIKEDRGI
jgi:hypothetical protein